MLYPFELLNISIIFTNIEHNIRNQSFMRFARANFRRALHVHLGFDHRKFFSAISSSNNKGAVLIFRSGIHLDPRHLDPRHQEPRNLDPRYCAVYKTVETGVEMFNFGKKVGHLDPC